MLNRTTIEAYVNAHYEEAVELLETLGRIPAPSRQEDRRAAFCRDWFLAQGAQEAWVDAAKNTICPIGCDASPGGTDEMVVFMAHSDVVFNDTDELPLRREGDILHAPGIGDDTANLVNLMLAAKYLLTEKPALDTGVLVVANACEEGLGNLDGCKEIMRVYGDRIKEVYSFDGYFPQCTDTPVGSHRYALLAKAAGGHSYLDFGKENAIVAMAELIQALYRVTPPTADTTTYNVGRIEGGSTVNSLPQECRCLYEYRSPSQECLEIMQKELEAALEASRRNGHEVELELLGVRPGKGTFAPGRLEAFTASNLDLIRTWYDGECDRQPYSTDSNVPLSMGIPANTIGTVVGAKAHTREEWVDLTSLPRGMSIILSLMGKYIS
ncbi:M20/M25/M40 family metallo-hydrolase [Desulfovibrio sp. OttesenSCG-928-I05]|nr:M20/M25/M40 family metallo-hydrolase [Desulfovibrio sp. OttesenSCG-928-I05]